MFVSKVSSVPALPAIKVLLSHWSLLCYWKHLSDQSPKRVEHLLKHSVYRKLLNWGAVSVGSWAHAEVRRSVCQVSLLALTTKMLINDVIRVWKQIDRQSATWNLHKQPRNLAKCWKPADRNTTTSCVAASCAGYCMSVSWLRLHYWVGIM